MKTKLTIHEGNADAEKNYFLRVSPRSLRLGVLFLLCGGVLLLLPARAATTNLTALLQQGLFEEQANRNLDAAIEEYSALAKQFDKDRQLAATAVFRLGECYRAQGKTNEAAAQYQRVLRDFSDQTVLATLSRQNLAGMGAARNETSGANVPAENPDAVLFKKLEGKSQDELEKVLPTVMPDAALADLIKWRDDVQLKLSVSSVDYASNHPSILRLKTELDQAQVQIGAKISGMMQGLKLRAELPEANILATEARHLQKQSITSQIKLAEQDLADTQKRMELGQASAADARNAERAVLRLKQQLAALDSGRTEIADLSVPVKSEEDQEIARIEKMIQNSPDLINGTPVQGSPLCGAAAAGKLRVAEFLLSHGADVNGLGDTQGLQPLIAAARAGQKAMVELLLKHGADINAASSSGQTALHEAVEQGFLGVTEVLLAAKPDLNQPNKDTQTPLLIAVRKNSRPLAALLLAHGANPNLARTLQPNYGLNPINEGRSMFGTPLHLAAARGDVAMMSLLLTNGADVKAFSLYDETPLQVAAARGKIEAVRLLLAAKADPNAGKKNTPLLSAILLKDTALAEMLLQAGANPNGIAGLDDSARPFGRLGNNFRDRVSPIWQAIQKEDAAMVSLVLKYKADANDSQTDQRAVIFSALDKPEILKALLDAGAKTEVRDETTTDNGMSSGNRQMMTPLLTATGWNQTNAVELLLAHGADTGATNYQGNTPLHLAAAGLADETIFAQLLAHGAKPNVRNAEGLTPLDLVIRGTTEPVWRFSQNVSTPTSEQKVFAEKMVALLRAHGAVDKLPDWDRISVNRLAGDVTAMVFQRGTNDWNHFTLLELIYQMNYRQDHGRRFPFPDLAHLTVVRPGVNGAEPRRITVNLLNETNGIEVSRDVPLEFGDMVEIPEREHTLAEPAVFYSGNQQSVILNHLRERAGEAKLIVAGGQTIALKIQPFFQRIDESLSRDDAKAVLISSSDLSRVKVSRRNARTGKAEEWIVNCAPEKANNVVMPGGLTVNSTFAQRLQAIQNGSLNNASSSAAPDLWLRDGDVIEVPQKK